MADLDRLLRSDDQRTALALILPQMHALDVITVVARLDSLEQIGVVGIAGARGGHKLVGLFLVRAVLRDNDNRAIEARLLEHMLDGDRIGYAAVDVFVPVNLDRRRHQRQRRRGANSVEVKYGAFDRKVRGGSKEHVRRDSVHLDGTGVEHLVVKGIQAVLDIVEDKVVAHNGARGRKRCGAHEAVVVAESQVDAVGTADLVRLVVHAVEGAGRYTVDSRNLDACLHENVEHACGELSAKTTALQDERDLAGVLCLIFCSHVDLLRLRFGFLLPSFEMASAQVLEQSSILRGFGGSVGAGHGRLRFDNIASILG